MRFARRDVRDHNAFHKNDHGPSYRPQRALQRYKRLNIDFRKIFRVVRFSTFSTVSANNSHSPIKCYDISRPLAECRPRLQ